MSQIARSVNGTTDCASDSESDCGGTPGTDATADSNWATEHKRLDDRARLLRATCTGSRVQSICCVKRSEFDSHPSLTVQTAFGDITICAPAALVAVAANGSLMADSVESLAALLKLPERRHTMFHWYSWEDTNVRGTSAKRTTVAGGGGETPTLTVEECKINGIVVSCHPSIEPYEMNLKGVVQLKLHWASPSQLRGGLELPPLLHISLCTTYGELIWHRKNTSNGDRCGG
jgi:hypothetical protein